MRAALRSHGCSWWRRRARMRRRASGRLAFETPVSAAMLRTRRLICWAAWLICWAAWLDQIAKGPYSASPWTSASVPALSRRTLPKPSLLQCASTPASKSPAASSSPPTSTSPHASAISPSASPPSCLPLSTEFLVPTVCTLCTAFRRHQIRASRASMVELPTATSTLERYNVAIHSQLKRSAARHNSVLNTGGHLSTMQPDAWLVEAQDAAVPGEPPPGSYPLACQYPTSKT